MATATALSEVGVAPGGPSRAALPSVAARSGLPTRSARRVRRNRSRTPLHWPGTGSGSSTAEMRALGGDEAERAREIDLLRHQVDEIEGAGDLRADGGRRSDRGGGSAFGCRRAQRCGSERPGRSRFGERGSPRRDRAGGRTPRRASTSSTSCAYRAHGLQAEAADLASELRRVVETWEDDPERLAAVSLRRARLADLRRKYGSTLEEVTKYGEDAKRRLVELESADETAAALAACR